VQEHRAPGASSPLQDVDVDLGAILRDDEEAVQIDGALERQRREVVPGRNTDGTAHPGTFRCSTPC
jgi:hypothetical protein